MLCIRKLRQAWQAYARHNALTAHQLHLPLPPYPMVVALDANKFLQVVTNLLGNLIKFTPDGGHLINRLTTSQDTVFSSFADDGLGIPGLCCRACAGALRRRAGRACATSPP